MVEDNKEVLKNTLDILANSLEKYKNDSKNNELLEKVKKLKSRINN